MNNVCMFAGLDIGSTNAKFSIYSGEGRLIAEAVQGYMTAAAGKPMIAEDIWEAAQQVMITACAKLPPNSQIAAMAISTFGEAMIPIDTHGRVLSDQFIFSFTEGDEELRQILKQVPAERIQSITGVFPHKHFPLIKMLWLRLHTPLYKQTDRYLQMEGFLLYRLTGRFAVSDSSAARTVAYDCKNHCWSQPLLDLVGVSANKLSEILPSGSYVGVVRREICDKLGLSGEMRVYAGGHDQMCNALGAGLLDLETMINCSGTVECISGVADLKQTETLKQTLSLQFAPYPQHPELCFSFWAPVAGCSSLDWCLRLTSGQPHMKDRELAGRHISMQELCSERPPSLLIVPYFTGRNNPKFSETAPSLVCGMTLKTTPQEFYQSIMEGIAFELKLCLEQFLLLSSDRQRMIVTGGGARSDYWSQMKANILCMPTSALEHRQAGTMGAMLLAAVGFGYYRDLQEAAASCIRLRKTFYPQERICDLFEEKFNWYNILRQGCLME